MQPRGNRLNRFAACLFLSLVVGPFAGVALAADRPLAPVPPAIASEHFRVTVDGRETPVYHAALSLYFLNFDARKHSKITVTADTDDFWQKGVEVQPWRLGIRPKRAGRTISFTLDGPAKVSISRPGDYLANAEMLYLFANQPEQHAPTAARPGLRYFGPGVHTENIDAAAGESIYLAPGAVVFGSLNIWGVDRVKVFGRGVIVYDGPQNPADDDGWMHKRNWHCIVMDNAHDISIEGITCVVRSRTWQIQMKDSRRIVFDNVKVIGANEGNANADGMDWLGGGDTVVRDSFFRAADDIFAMQTSWEGYGPAAFALQGSPVTNVTVENSVLSTSISNIVRAGWPEKNFEGGNFRMRDTDVLHMGLGGCGVPFALMEFWADPNGRGQSAGFHFDNIRLEDWYSLAQLRQPTPGIRDVSFTDVAALEQPPLVASILSGEVGAVALDNVSVAGKVAQAEADARLERRNGAAAALISNSGPEVRIVSDAGLVRPGQTVHFEAIGGDAASGLHYTWIFGDGTTAAGRKVKHRFPDTEGTLRDGTGRFRVLLHISTANDRHSWSYLPVVVSEALQPAQAAGATEPGVRFTYSESGSESGLAAVRKGVAKAIALPEDHRDTDYAYVFEGQVRAAVDGTYSFLLIANDHAEMVVDGSQRVTLPKPFANVCGLAGNAARAVSLDLALAKGAHTFRVSETHGAGQDDFRVLWRSPGGAWMPVSGDSLSHEQEE